MNALNSEPMVTAQAISQQFALPPSWLLRRAQREALGIPYYHIGHVLRFRQSEVEAWVKARATVIEPEAARDDRELLQSLL